MNRFEATLQIYLDWTARILDIESQYHQSVRDAIREAERRMRDSPQTSEEIAIATAKQLAGLDQSRVQQREEADAAHRQRLDALRS